MTGPVACVGEPLIVFSTRSMADSPTAAKLLAKPRPHTASFRNRRETCRLIRLVRQDR
jgi:hypothetical protein